MGQIDGRTPIPQPALPQFRVLVVDHNLEFIDSVRRFLALNPRIEVVGTAQSGHAALNLIAALHPDAVLIDVSLPDRNSFEVVREIKAQKEPSCVIIMAMDGDDGFREAAKVANADGFMAKTEFGEQSLALIYQLCGALL